ncbi:hypothetical protein [uncultured Acetobacterium sp.]|uniref:hypothetical protein n=1 Tax=uncultured Acetobacterium sp. TaxID=217139 RepID=UPI0025DFFAB9|nr:hypothetical protein [uncultured Acetobacterium sp.]
MENLITIETVPIKIDFVEKEQLKLSAVHNTQLQVKQQSEHQIQSQPVRLTIQDSYEPSSSYAWDNATYTAVPKFDTAGNLSLDISMEDGESRAIRFKHANRSIESMSSKAKINDQDTGNLQMTIPISRLSSGMPETNNFNTEFMPPDLQLIVTQRPEVIIKYVGGPIYVPPSADPNYSPPIGFEQQQIASQQIPLLDEKV